MALLAFLDKFVKFATDQRRVVEVIFFHSLSLVLPDGDVLPSYDIRTMRKMRISVPERGPVGRVANMFENCAALYPPPARGFAVPCAGGRSASIQLKLSVDVVDRTVGVVDTRVQVDFQSDFECPPPIRGR